MLVIATLQSESQGMGVQEWLVNVLSTVNKGKPLRRTFTTADFGPNGTLLRTRRSAREPCRLLTTRGEERDTKQGKRLFLIGELTDVLIDKHEHGQSTTFARRLDHGLEELRLADRLDRPLVFFKQ